MKDFTNYSLLPYNTFGMDVKAARFVEYESVDELQCFLNGRQEKDAPLLHVGRGSNLLFVSDYSGTVLHSGIKGMQVVQETEDFVDLRVGAGEVWDDLVDYTVQKGWYGAENLSLIPGEVGASAVQNIGAYGVEAKDLIVAVETVSVATGELRVFTNEACRYAYRESIFKQELKGKYIVTYVTYRLKNIRCIIGLWEHPFRIGKRGRDTFFGCSPTNHHTYPGGQASRPGKIGNAGSFFMNPIVSVEQFEALCKVYPDMPHYKVDENRVKIPAGWMIDRCGWKGKHLGRAGVHDKQALVLVNLGGATGEEVVRLSEAIVRSVKEKFGIAICPEVNFIGEKQ